MAEAPTDQLSEEQKTALAQGQHEKLAEELSGSKPALAGWVLEQIWDFAPACELFLRANQAIDALRCALESRNPDLIEKCLQFIESGTAEQQDQAVAFLEKRGRHDDVVRLLSKNRESEKADERTSDALQKAGHPLEAAKELIKRKRFHEALSLLESLPGDDAAANEYAAYSLWELGSTLESTRRAQRAIHLGAGSPKLYRHLAECLNLLGYRRSSEILLSDGEELFGQSFSTPTLKKNAKLPARYQLRTEVKSTFSGSTYVAWDRRNLEEVELHLLLSDAYSAQSSEIKSMLHDFGAQALAATRIRHPAIRPIRRFVSELGMLVLPPSEGPSLLQWILSPKNEHTPLRSCSFVSFLAKGLAAAHARGIVHGAILPSRIYCDRLGRPQLGPFGTHLLSRLAATQTQGLDELVHSSAPERLQGASPSTESDIYSLGSLFLGLLTGSLRSTSISKAPEALQELIASTLSSDPSSRPNALQLAEACSQNKLLSTQSKTLLGLPALPLPLQENDPSKSNTARSVSVLAHPSWGPQKLDLIAAIDCPWFQAILDRDDRRFTLAKWPNDCEPLELTDVERKKQLDQFVEHLQTESEYGWLHECIRHSGELIKSPSGDVMLSLDALLKKECPSQ